MFMYINNHALYI